MAKVNELKTTADIDEMLAASEEEPVALLKHSIACPISARGQGQFVGLEEDGDPPLYAVVVQYARSISDELADRLGIRHETPQAVIIRNGDAVFHQNHYAINTAALRHAAREAV